MEARSGVRYTADYLWETPDDGNRYEVIDGELYVTPPPVWMHQYGIGRLFWLLADWIFPRGLGKTVTAPVGVVLDAGTGVEPDLVYVARQREAIISERGIEGAPDLVVEALSPSTERRDRGVKLERYARAGIPHYWLLDPRSRVLEPYRLGPQGYELLGRFGPGMMFRPELFPGLEIAIDDLWS
jgi:Uma2 family endonuclease